jgi:hypothetical protein
MLLVGAGTGSECYTASEPPRSRRCAPPQRNLQTLRIQAPGRQASADFIKDGTQHHSHATARDHDIGFEKVHEVSQPHGRQIDRFEQDFLGQRITRRVRPTATSRLTAFPMFERQSPLPPSVLVYSTELQDSLRHILESETADDTQIGLRDAVTGVRLTLKLPAQRAAIALIGKHERTVLAKYGF